MYFFISFFHEKERESKHRSLTWYARGAQGTPWGNELRLSDLVASSLTIDQSHWPCILEFITLKCYRNLLKNEQSLGKNGQSCDLQKNGKHEVNNCLPEDAPFQNEVH